MAQKKETTKETSKSEASNTWAVVTLAGKQLIVKEGGEYTINTLGKEKGEKLSTSEVLLVVDSGKVKIGKPFVKGSSVDYEVVANKKGEKVKSFHFKAKSRFRKTVGSRAHLTRVIVKKITA